MKIRGWTRFIRVFFVCFVYIFWHVKSDYRKNQYLRISNFVVFGGILLESRCWQWGPYLKHNISECFSHLWERWWNGCHACRKNNVTMTEGLVLRAREADIYLTTFCKKTQDRTDKSRVRFQWRDLCLSPCAQGVRACQVWKDCLKRIHLWSMVSPPTISFKVQRWQITSRAIVQAAQAYLRINENNVMVRWNESAFLSCLLSFA